MSTIINFTMKINGKEKDSSWRLLAASTKNNEYIVEFINCLFDNYVNNSFQGETIELVRINNIIEE